MKEIAKLLDKPVIFAIVGPSGSGKTTVAESTSEILGIPVLRSYTTRPMRDGETQNKEHIFVSDRDIPSRNSMIAYTFFGGYHYWATRNQVDGKSAILYVIDEVGLEELLERFEKIYYIVPIYISCQEKPWMNDEKRASRDVDRKMLKPSFYREIINNDSTLEKLVNSFSLTITHLVNYPIEEIANWCRERAGLPLITNEDITYATATTRRKSNCGVRS